jgi:hypothetical protein
VARVSVKYVAGASREHHERILEALQLLYKAPEARDDAYHNPDRGKWARKNLLG